MRRSHRRATRCPELRKEAGRTHIQEGQKCTQTQRSAWEEKLLRRLGAREGERKRRAGEAQAAWTAALATQCLKDEHGSQQITGPPPAASVTLSLRPELALQLRVLAPRSLGQQPTE